MILDSLRAVLFDLDGTLLDTFDFIYGAFEHTFATHGIPPLTRERVSGIMGGPLEEVYLEMAPGWDSLALCQTHRTFQSNNLHLARLFPDTIAVLEHLRSRGFKIGAITTRSIRTSVRSLEQVGIAHYFDIIISAEDVIRVKPDPEPLLKALGIMGLKPEDAVMVGDTIADIQAGKNAGTKTVAALYGFGGDRLLAAKPDYAIWELRALVDILSI